MSDTVWFRSIVTEPHRTPAPGARVSSNCICALYVVADSLGPEPILVVQINIVLDLFPSRVETRHVSVEYTHEELFELYCDWASDDPYDWSHLPNFHHY